MSLYDLDSLDFSILSLEVDLLFLGGNEFNRAAVDSLAGVSLSCGL
jgi:hypothetical protein